MPAHRPWNGRRLGSLVALTAVLSLTLTPARAEKLEGMKWGGCTHEYTMSGYDGGPGAGFVEEGDSIKNYTVTIGPKNGYARSWADAGYRCGPDPQPHENAKKIVIQDVFRVDGTQSIDCDTDSITISWPPAFTHTFCQTISSKKIELSGRAGTCKAKNGVPECIKKYSRWTIEAEGDVKFFRYCRQIRVTFIGPTGDSVAITAPPSISSKCIVNEDFFD